jgi:hypothetical protein
VTQRTEITSITNKQDSPDQIKQVEIDEEGTWDEFSFGTNPDTSDRLREDSMASFNSGDVPVVKKNQFPVPKMPKQANLNS